LSAAKFATRCDAFCLILLAALVLSTANVHAQQVPQTDDILLYAHSDNGLLVLNASAPSGRAYSAFANRTITFTLNPTLSSGLRISGSVFATIDINATAPFSGVLSTWVSELTRTGSSIIVTGTNTSAPIVLQKHLESIPLGVGPIDYEFQSGSSIQLNARVLSSNSSVAPTFVWDLPSNRSAPLLFPTSVRISVVKPTNAELTFLTDQSRTGTIIEANPDCDCAKVEVRGNVTDALGAYRLSGSLIVTAPNGTSIQVQAESISTYSMIYSYNASLGSGLWQTSLRLIDSSGNSYAFEKHAWVSPFYRLNVRVTDESNQTIPKAMITVSFRQEANWTTFTDSNGLGILSVPSTTALGSPLNLTVTFRELRIGPQRLYVSGNLPFHVILPLYNPQVRVLMAGVLPVPDSNVTLLENGTAVSAGKTGYDGYTALNQIPAGNCTIHVNYFLGEYETNSTIPPSNNAGLSNRIVITVNVPLPDYLTFSLLAVIAATVTVSATRRRMKLHPQPFSHFNQLARGGLPKTCFVVIAGNSGSGKTVLTECLIAQQLKQNQHCILLTNTEYPNKIRESMTSLGVSAQDLSDASRFLFIDAYSALGGGPSSEEFHVTSHTDLTDLGMNITKCLDRLSAGTDVYVDSLNPMLTALQPGSVINFLQSIAARVKANGGKLCVIVGTGIEKTNMTKLEENSDCVIETELQDASHGQTRRLRIKKLRDSSYNDRWIRFQIEASKGIIFLTRRK